MDAITTDLLAARQADMQTRIDYAVARKMLDSQEVAGDAAIELIKAAGEAQAAAAKGFAGVGEALDRVG